jgi:hypothetical protein
MQIQIELTEESRELLMRHFKESAPLHEVLARAQRNELAGVTVYSFECDLQQATELLEMARGHCPPAVKDIEPRDFCGNGGLSLRFCRSSRTVNVRSPAKPCLRMVAQLN